MEKMNHKDQSREYWLNLIVDYLTGTISEASSMELEKWIAASDANRQYYKELKNVWDSMDAVDGARHFNDRKAYLLFKSRIGQQVPIKIKKTGTTRRLLAYAAVILPFIILSFFTYSYVEEVKIDKNPISKITVPNGSKSQLELKDGTKVWLNAGSTLELGKQFGKEKREVILYGEASFEVARNEEKPFIVNTGVLDVCVKGTTFNVNTYKENNEVKVALLEGTVEVRSHTGEVIQMKPYDMAVYDINTRKLGVHENAIDEAFGWRDNRLVFKGETFLQIALMLERNFNVRINIHRESVKKQCFFGDFVKSETIEQVIDVMSTNRKFTYRIQGNTIDIY